MIKFDKIYLFIGLLSALCSCTKGSNTSDAPLQDAMLFGVEEIAETKVAYSQDADDKIIASFTEGDEIGVYAYYNNFYYYYTEYADFAESVIFANHQLTVGDDGESLSYSPLRSWTFSTLYGTAPHTLDAFAYYPFKADYNYDYVYIEHTYPDAEEGTSGGAGTLIYWYAYDYDENDVNYGAVNSDIDFMTAHTRYDDSETPENFREDMLSLTAIPFAFTRQTASLNLQVTKPDDYASTITVTGITVYYDAYRKFTQSINSSSVVTWSEMTTGYALEASKTGLNVELDETDWDSTPTEDSYNEVDNLLANDNLLHFPPDTQINKIVFTISGATTNTYTWHPHIATFVANTHYTLNLELDPERAN